MALKTVQFNQIQNSTANYKDIQKVTFKKAWWRRGQKVFIQVNTAEVAGSQACPILGAMRKSVLPDTSRGLPHQPERGTGCSSAAFLYWKRTGWTVFHTVIKSIFFWAINKDFFQKTKEGFAARFLLLCCRQFTQNFICSENLLYWTLHLYSKSTWRSLPLKLPQNNTKRKGEIK